MPIIEVNAILKLFPATYLHVRMALGPQFFDGHVRASIAENVDVLRQQIIAKQPPDCRVDLLGGQIALDSIQFGRVSFTGDRWRLMKWTPRGL